MKHLVEWASLSIIVLVATIARAAAPDFPVHDPVMIRQGDTYYLFNTGEGIAVHSSKDLRTWKEEPPVFARAPEWTFTTVVGFKGHIWAPDISEHNGTYYLYYAISMPGKITSAIGVATNKILDHASPDFKWVDRGMVLQSVAGRDLWNAIDPQLVVDDEGTPWLAFGSFWSGLKLVKMQPDMLRVAEPEEWHGIAKRERSVLVADAEPEPAAIEAPFIFRKNGYYYLFASWDYCCRGLKSTYKVVIGRSKDIRGPYLDQKGLDMAKGGGTLVVAGSENWSGVGHSATYTFEGKDYLIYHAYDAHDAGKPRLKIVELKWDADAWPVIDRKAAEAR